MRPSHVLKVLAWIGLAAFIAAAPASAGPASFTGTLEVFVGDGFSGLPSAAQFSVSGSGSASYTSGAFTLPAGAFTTNGFLPLATNVGGSIPVPPTPFTLYTIGSVINQSNRAGSFAPGSGPAGGFGGVMSAGASLTVQLGLSGLPPGPFLSIFVPLPVGGTTVPGTAGISILPNAVTVSFDVTPWSTGAVTFNDGNLGTTVTGVPISNPFLTAGSVMGSNGLGPAGGTISLVSPFTVKITGTGEALRAGYGRLTLTFVPEPDIVLYFGTAGAAVFGLRVSRRRPTRVSDSDLWA